MPLQLYIKIIKVAMMTLLNKLMLFISTLTYITNSIQLCDPYTTPYPCTNCQPYASPNNGFCQCDPGYYMAVDLSYQYCDLCHSSCKTCYGPLSTNCISCPSSFTFNNSTTTCDAPSTVNQSLITQAYSIEGFTVLSGWSFSGFSVSSIQCGLRTILGGTISSSSNFIQVDLSSLPTHFRVRVRAQFYFFNANSVAKNAYISIGSNVNFSAVDQSGYSHESCLSRTYVTGAIDLTLLHSGATASLKFYTNVNYHWGLRDVIITVWKCASNCSTCFGYLATECYTCSESAKRTANQIIPFTCQCTGNYYQQPYAGTCVDPCPSVPIKYYGDNTTRNCVTTCPTGYGIDDFYRCWNDCPTTSPKSGKLLYRDDTNKACVENCPTIKPYGDPVNRRCYSQCPSPRFGSNTTDMICVTTCPHTYLDSGIYKTYSSGRYCVPFCPSTTFADPATASCKNPCTGTFSLMDNSTGENLCVTSCPPPNRFASSGTCVQVCPIGQYGDITNWQCTVTCTSPNWGLQSYNRKCVPVCPSETWAKSTTRTCVNTTLQCNPNYADNYSRTCVVATACSFGTYGDPTTFSCVTYCPSGRFGHPTTRVCQLSCASPYFADPGVNLCLSDCVTTGLYADQSTSRKCVAQCNRTGATPWADDSTRRCVSDCNNTFAKFLSDNTTWKCVFDCPLTHVADFTTTAPKCVLTCPTGWYADATPVTYRICVEKCSTNPPQFGDSAGGLNLCVDVCASGTFGDQTGNRLCRKTCPSPYFAQNNDLRRCVKVCNQSSYGYQQTCTYHATNCPYSYKRVCYQDPHSCPTDFFGDPSTQLCVNPCPATQVTFGDPQSKLCVRQCPDYPAYTAGSYVPQTYYADISNRQCVLRCSSTYSPPLFGNNQTKTCQSKCKDFQSYAQVQSTYRICVNRCWVSPTFHYANNLTKTCGTFMNCPSDYYGENATQMCVQSCPNTSWGFRNATRRLCMDVCPVNYVGDDSTQKRICILQCPIVPDRYADTNLRICVDMCNSSLYGQPIQRTCTSLCPAPLYFSYQPTRRCLTRCPYGYFADDRSSVRKCQPSSNLCTGRFGDAYLRACVSICTGPSPVNTFGSGSDCVSFCPNGTYADSYSASRRCVSLCPPGVINSVAAPNLYGDPTTRTCQAKCITPFTWADYQTRLCQTVCSPTPTPTYSQNFYMTCVTALNCPTSPTKTFGDNTTRSCVSFCSNNQWGDPTSRNCVTQCPNVSTTGTSRFYGDNSTGQKLCVQICPSTPRLFGQNDTNLCVVQCPALTYGDQTGNRSCVPQCPLFGLTYWYAQNDSRICVLVCKNGTWGLNSTRQCVQNPFHCGSLWADNSTRLCVTTCPSLANLFGDFATRICVPICPNGTFADDLTRTCVTRCPQNNGVHDTFGNNDTHICQQTCTQANAYADPQTLNRYCVIDCSQSTQQSFADPSTKFCVPRCPTFPSLYGQRQNFRCVSECISPYFADTHTRRCELNCDLTTQFKLRSPRMCVTTCPSSQDLFGDSGTRFCQTSCSTGYRYSILRLCVPSCTTYSLFDFNGTCVKYCPYTYYADTNGHCVNPCPLATLFGQNTTTTCRATCITGYAYNRLCVAVCPDNLWGYNGVCQSVCPAGTASNVSNLCIGLCDPNTFNQNGVCVTNCTTDYADPNTRLCSTSCTLSRYRDPATRTCVQVCPPGSYRDPSFICKTNCSPLRSDDLTNTCTSTCSNGTWGYNNTCVSQCPALFYGYLVNRDCYNIANIPDGTLFADNITQTWVSICSQNPLRFGDTQSHQCVTACSLATQYADPQSRKCETGCTNSSYYLDQTTKTCVLICPTGYFANPQNGKCQQDCTLGRFNYGPTNLCVVNCPKPYYGFQNTSNNVCVLQCPSGKYAEGVLCKSGCTLPLIADPVTRFCVSTCIDSYASINDVACVDVAGCVAQGQIADNSTNRCVPICPTDPDYYQQNGQCVAYCATGTYSDPTTGVRVCTSLCTQGLYGDPVSGRCLTSCLPGYYAFEDTNLCLLSCPNGFADNETGACVSNCPSPTFADTLNNKCMRICSNGQYGEGRVCVSSCTDLLYGNPLTRQCQSSCPSFDYIFAENTTNLCVKNCSFVAGSYADRANNYCMDACSRSNQYALDVFGICTSLCPEGQFMENSTKKCQSGCTTGYAQPTTRFCVTRCFGNPQTFAQVTDRKCIFRCLTPTQNLYADNNTNFCVNFDNCSRTPPTFSDPISGHCVLFCPEGLYAENTTFTCTSFCILGFADNLTRKCMDICPVLQQTYGDPTTHRCVKVCPSGWFANNVTQQCVEYNNCPIDSWSDIKSKHCVARCPSQPEYFGYDTTTSCVLRCPSTPELYGDTVTQKCIWPCTNHNGQRRFADPTSQKCVFVCPISLGLYGDPTTGKCTTTCDPLNPFKDNSTQRCVALCPSNPDYYAYSLDHTCVRVCPDGLFASDPTTRVCTNSCQNWLTFADQTTNRCVTRCPIPYFADDSTYVCVLRCPSVPDYFADPHTRTCVPSCSVGPNDANGNPQWISWQQTINRTCVTRCPVGYYAQNSSGRCTDQCPPSQYADPIIQVCVAQCTVRPGYYKQTRTLTCVTQCPTTPIKAHKYEVTHTCVNMSGSVSGCPSTYFANQIDSACTQLCPSGYYADTHSKFCRLNCTNGQFADPVDRRCKTGCTTNPHWFAYSIDMICVQYCPSPYFSQNSTWTCTMNCPNFTDNTVLYAYQITRQCVIKCPAPYYSYIIDQTCIQGCPDTWFANDETRTCDQSCTGTYNSDTSTNRCVQNCPTLPNLYALNNQCVPSCPDGKFKDNSTRSCVTECPYLPLTYGDDSTNQCVFDCPSTANYFADNQTRRCVSNCSQGFFADPSTRTCVQSCPQNSNTYADPLSWVCQPYCPAPNYASSLTNQCVDLCPNQPIKTYAQDSGRFCTTRCIDGLFGNNQTRKCQANCLSMTDAFADTTSNLCVTTCPVGFFAYGPTAECRRDCPGFFADSTTRKCVSNCPGTQRLYADPTTQTCVPICPVGLYGETATWTCQSSCASVSAGFILQVSRQCVSQCPSPYFALVSQRLCVENCGTSLYGNPINRQCETCPNVCITCLSLTNCLSCTSGLYLQFGACVSSCTVNTQIANYANSITMTCGSALRCQAGTFGNNGTQTCQISCPTQMYGNSTTRTCQNCPATCSACISSTNCSACVSGSQLSIQDNVCYQHCSPTLQYNYAGVCYAVCPPGTYLDYTNVYCQACNAICLTCYGSSMNCTSCDNTFQFNNSCLTKCPSGYYGSNSLCSVCTDQIPSCTQPLTFNTTTTVQNYQQVVIIKFNQNTTVNGKPEDFIKVNLQMTRRLLPTVSDVVNNGVSFIAVVLPDGTIKLYLAPGLSLDNVKYNIIFTNPNSVIGVSGATLQNLQSLIQLTDADVYPQQYTTKSPLVIAGKILAIIMLALTFFMLFIGLSPLYVAIQAVQMMSLFAYTKDLAPNLFYFLKQLRLSRFVFIPSIFNSVYIQPQGFVQSIPQKVLDTENYLSFSVNATSFIYFVFLFTFMTLFVFVFTSRLITNRPLKLVFQKIWETRIKFGVINDFIWVFALNVFVQWFMQFRYTQNMGDLALAIIFGLITLGLSIGVIVNAIVKYRKNQQLILNNYGLLMEGTKQQWYHKFFIFIYNIRKLLFAVILVSTIFNTRTMAASMLTLYSLVGLAIIIIRPYKQHISNIVILLNEGFLGFFCGGVLYYLGMLSSGQPSGAKITNGFILTIVIIIHLSLIMAWGIYRCYIYIKQMRQQFKKTQFYVLYMDEQYDEIIQKQISELNEQQKGQVQSIQITNISKNDKQQIDQQDEIIKLKIKRRVRKQKLNKKKQTIPINSPIEQHKSNIKSGQYVKLQQNNQKYYKLKSSSRGEIQDQYEKIIFDQSSRPNQRENYIQENKQEEWIKLQKLNNNYPQQKQKLDIKQEVEQIQGYEQTQVKNIFDSLHEQQSKQLRYNKSNIGEFQEIINNNQDQKKIQEQKLKKRLQNEKKMRQTYKSSFADFDESNYFTPEQNQNGFYKNNNKQLKKQDEQQQLRSPRFNQQQAFSQLGLNSKINLDDSKSKVEKLQINNNNQKQQQQVYSQQFQNQQQQQPQKEQPQKQDQKLNNQLKQEKIINQPKKQQDYKVFNFDELQLSEQNNNEPTQQAHNSSKIQRKQQKKLPEWSLQVEDLMQDKNQDEQEKKRKQKSKKMHLMLFDEDEDALQ